MSENGNGKLKIKDMTKKAFEVWLDTAAARMGVAMIGEDKREHLKLLLETCFEQAFTAGGAVAMEHAAEAISKSIIEKLAKEGIEAKVASSDAIPMPGVGHA